MPEHKSNFCCPAMHTQNVTFLWHKFSANFATNFMVFIIVYVCQEKFSMGQLQPPDL